MPAATTYEIGAALGSIATLASLNIPNPESEFYDWADSTRLATGKVRALGYPQATWHYGFLTSAQYDAIRAFCLGASAIVCIATSNNDRDYVRYDCIMNMPETFIIRAGRYIDVTITFNQLAEAE